MYTKGVADWRELDRIEATAWLRRWVGPRAYEVLWRRLFDLKFYEHADKLSAAWIGTRIKRVALSRKSLFQEELGYLEGGSQVLLDAYRSRLDALAVKFTPRAPVRRVVTENGRATALETAAGLHPATTVVSTVPLKYVPRFAPDLTDAERERIAAIENIGVCCVLLKLKRPFIRNFWMNINDARLEIPGIIEYTNLNPLATSIVYFPYYMPKTHPKWSGRASASSTK
jgi:protoporphyrinogen oxidase